MVSTAPVCYRTVRGNAVGLIYLLFIAIGVAAARSSSSGSVPVSHLANVEALVQRAAAEAARCGSAQMEHNIERQSSVPRGAPPSYAASTAVVCVELVLQVMLCLVLSNQYKFCICQVFCV